MSDLPLPHPAVVAELEDPTELPEPAELPVRRSEGDPSTQSNIDEVTTEHISLEWEVDFEARQIRGAATLKVRVIEETTEVVFDTRDLGVSVVTVDGVPVKFRFCEFSDVYGSAMRVPLGKVVEGDQRTVRVEYVTHPESTALSWLAPEQTDGKKHPYLYSQCQAIHARSLFPCQDSPGVRSTYDAEVKAPADLVVLMSAMSDGPPEVEDDMQVTRWSQPVPMASNLWAIVVGAVGRRDISERVAVYCEERLLDTAAFDFQDTEKCLCFAEQMLGPYVWGRYDIVVLPGSTPYGGMENVCLTYISPTVVTGDRSLFSVVAHEIAHSWTGNLVGPLSWEEFYLNEGFTMYLERRFMNEIEGDHYFDFDAIDGKRMMEESVKRFGKSHPFTALRPDLEGVDPDVSFSSVPYEKGFAFVCYLRSIVGCNELFEAWMREYIQDHALKSITTEQMVGHLKWWFSEENPEHPKVVDFSSIDWARWLDEPGVAPCLPVKESKLLQGCIDLAQTWTELCKGKDVKIDASDIEGWMFNQVLCVFEKFKRYHGERSKAVPKEVLTKLNDVYNFNDSPNDEILFQWLMLCVRNDWCGHEEQLENFLGRVGRMKFALPLYRLLMDTDLPLAKRLYEKYENWYHPVTAKLIRNYFEE